MLALSETTVDATGGSMANVKVLTSGRGVSDCRNGQPAGDHSGDQAAALSQGNRAECGSLRWYVAKLRAWEDQKAADRMRKAGFEAHAFREEVRGNRRNSILRPLFPCYLFFRAGSGRAQIGRALRLTGDGGETVILGVLGTADGSPTPVPAEVIGYFLDHADGKDIFTEPVDEVPEAPLIGELLEVQVGPWARFVGKCKSDHRGRVEVALSIFGREKVVSLAHKQVQRVA